MTVSEGYGLYDADVLRNLADKTRRNYRSAMVSLLKSVGDVPVELLTYQHIVRWRLEREAIGIASSTIAHDLSKVRELLKYLKKRNLKVLDHREIELPRIKHKPPVWLQPAEVGKILGVIESPRDKALFACLFDSGARISELLSLDRDSIQDGQAHIVGKGDKPGILHFSPNALTYVERYMATRTDRLRPLFISGHRRRITVSRVLQLSHQYADYAGIDKNVTTHVFRHSFATDLKNNGADIYDIMQQLRHSQITTTMVYVHTGDAKKQRDYNNFHTKVPLVD